MTLYEINTTYRQALDDLQFDEETGEILNTEALDALEGVFDEKMENYALYVKELTGLAALVAEEAKALSKRKKALENKVEYLKGRMAESLLIKGQKEFETPRCKLTFRKSTKVVIFDEAAVPDGFKKEEITISVDKMKIKDTLKSGGEVEGASLVECNNLQVK